MIDLTTLKSANPIEDEGQIIERVIEADETWRKSNPRHAAWGLSGTQVMVSSERVVVTKRSSAAVAPTENLDAAAVRALIERRGLDVAAGDEGRILSYWASDDRKDRHGDRVQQNWVMDDFSRNPIMLHGHQWEAPPIGSVIDWKTMRRQEPDYAGDALKLTTLFATREQYCFADTIYRLSSAGIMRSGSVGFLPGRVIEVKDKKERDELGLGPNGLIFDQNGLIEWSIVSVPANPGAHRNFATAKSAGLLLASDVQVIRELARRQAPDETTWRELDRATVSAWKSLFPETRVPEHRDPTQPVEQEVSSRAAVSVVESLRELFVEVRDSLNQQKQVLSDIRDHLEERPVEDASDEHEVVVEEDPFRVLSYMSGK